MRMLQENSKPENKMRSTTIERFRYGQANRSGQFVQAATFEEDESIVTWPQILLTFATLFFAGSLFLCIAFIIPFLSLFF